MTDKQIIERYDKPNGDIVITLRDFCSEPCISTAMILYKIFEKLPTSHLYEIKRKLDEVLYDR